MEQLNPSNPDEFPMLLIGNKCDMQNEMKVNNEDIQNYCKEHNNMPFYMCSAKDNINLEEAFNKIVETALEKQKDDGDYVPKVPNLKLTQEPKKKKGCCK